MYRINKESNIEFSEKNYNHILDYDFTHVSPTIGKCRILNIYDKNGNFKVTIGNKQKRIDIRYIDLSKYILEVEITDEYKEQNKYKPQIQEKDEDENTFDKTRFERRKETSSVIPGKDQIYEYLKNERKVNKLVHVTHIDNIESILKFGLLSRDRITRKRMKCNSLDDFAPNRINGAVPLWVEKKDNYVINKSPSKNQLVTLHIDLDILKYYESQFFFHNHKSIEFTKGEYKMTVLKSLDMCKKMFGNNLEIMKTTSDFKNYEYGYDSYAKLKFISRKKDTPQNHTTSNQAEILVFDNINWSFISKIEFIGKPNMELIEKLKRLEIDIEVCT